ncbi:MAG: TetR/AcrR family transcriptional regulator [Parvibaculaceae bacterium]
MKENAKDALLDVSSVRSKVLSAASQILATRGAEALSLRVIAENAGIGLASIYHYFANKDDLLVALAVTGFSELRADILRYQAMPEFVSPMAASARAFFTFIETRPTLFSLMFNERLMAAHATLREGEQGILEIYQAAVITDERIPEQYRANAALALWALGRGMAAIISSYPHGEVPQELVARLTAGASYLINRPE